MKKIVQFSLLIFGIMCYTTINMQAQDTKAVKWYTWEEAVKANETNPKKFYVDVYTDWCGWCKVMDKKTFTDPSVAAYLNEHFYPIKLNAEQKGDINFQGNVFKWVEGGRRGVHTLAYSLLEGKMSYPSFVFLNEKYERIMISPGYKEPKDLMPELKYAVEELYSKNVDFNQYIQQQKSGDK